MVSNNRLVGIIRWCFLSATIVLTTLTLSCVPSSIESAGTTRFNASEGFQEIISISKQLQTTSDTATANVLIDKSRSFIKAHPKYDKVDQIYYILGSVLVEFDSPEEGIKVLEELIRYYPLAPSVEPGLLNLGIAYDKIGTHDKADEAYYKLLNNAKYKNGQFANTAKTLLETDISDRKGSLEALSEASTQTNFLNNPAIDFEVVNLNGEALSLAQYQGQIVLLDFWATWCPPCIAEMPFVKSTYQKYKNQNFEIIGISLDRDLNQLTTYLDKEGITWPQYYDNGGQIANLYRVQAIPTTYLIDNKGIIRYANLRGNALENAVRQLVSEMNSSHLE
ncbi:redoxin domain-containing protein [Candidatus Poribacteria bacterium]|nr:redoxin domain-containing protein [Candidatus Poribacteria bacterium]